MGLQGYAMDYRIYKSITGVYKGVQGITEVYKSIQTITMDYRGFQGITEDKKGIQGFTGDYNGLLGITQVYKGSLTIARVQENIREYNKGIQYYAEEYISEYKIIQGNALAIQVNIGKQKIPVIIHLNNLT